MGLIARKPDFVACEQQRRRPACASAQSDQRLCFSLTEKYDSLTCHMQNLKILVSLCSLADCFQHYLVANPEDRVYCVLSRPIYKYEPCQEAKFAFEFYNQAEAQTRAHTSLLSYRD